MPLAGVEGVTVAGLEGAGEVWVAFFTTDVGEPVLGLAGLVDVWVWTGALEVLVLGLELVGCEGCVGCEAVVWCV